VYKYVCNTSSKGSSLPPIAVSSLQPTLKNSCVLCVCAEVSSAHLLPWDRGEGEERGAGAAHLGQVLGQHWRLFFFDNILLPKIRHCFVCLI